MLQLKKIESQIKINKNYDFLNIKKTRLNKLDKIINILLLYTFLSFFTAYVVYDVKKLVNELNLKNYKTEISPAGLEVVNGFYLTNRDGKKKTQEEVLKSYEIFNYNFKNLNKTMYSSLTEYDLKRANLIIRGIRN